MHPAIDVDLVTFVLRNIERVSVRIEAAVLGHGPARRPFAEAAFRQTIQEMLDVVYEPAEVVEPIPRAFPLIHIAVSPIRQDGHGGFAIRCPAHDPVLPSYPLTGG